MNQGIYAHRETSIDMCRSWDFSLSLSLCRAVSIICLFVFALALYLWGLQHVTHIQTILLCDAMPWFVVSVFEKHMYLYALCSTEPARAQSTEPQQKKKDPQTDWMNATPMQRKRTRGYAKNNKQFTHIYLYVNDMWFTAECQRSGSRT